MNPTQIAVEKVDSTTIRVTRPTNINVTNLKTQLIQLQDEQQRIMHANDELIAKKQIQIDDIKNLIQLAREAGVI